MGRAEALTTLVAGVVLAATMQLLVTPQRRRRGEVLLALATAEWLDASMAPLMHQQHAALPEASAADIADERPLAAVHGGVCLQVRRLREPASADGTAERPLALMDQLVAP